jgi:uncharacterized membrane protein YbhN (UPF0104 family)
MFDGLPAVGRFPTEWVDFFILIGVLGLVLLAIFFWAIFIRKSKKRRIRRHKRRRSPNPTLAESGGLPPVRKGKNPDSPTPSP